jgi:hypothetical protein
VLTLNVNFLLDRLFLEREKKTIVNQGNIAFLTILDDALL